MAKTYDASQVNPNISIEFGDETNQDSNQPSMTQQAKNFLANYFTNADFGATGAGIEGMARIQAFLADKKIPFTDKDVTDIFMLVSQAPDRKKFTKEDIGKVIGMGEFVTEDMVGKNKPLTVGQVPGYLGNLLFGGTAEDMRKVRDEGLTVDEMKPGQKASMAAGFSEFTPLGLAPDIFRLGKAGINTGIKAIDDMITPVGATDKGMIMPMAISDEVSAGGVKTVDEMINEGVVTTGSKYYDDLGGFDDIVTRNVLINKNNRLSDILTGGSSSNRKDRLALRYQASKNKDLNEFVNKVNKLEKTKKIDDSIFNQFADIYNSKDFFKLQYLKNSIGKNKYAVLRDKANLIPAEEGGITKETLDEVTEMFNSISTKQPKMDVIVTKAENVLKKYKDKNLKATGYELKGNALGDVNIENILFEDKILKEYLTTGTGKEITERGSLLSKKKELLKTLKKQGVFEELGLSNYNITGSKVKQINDPQIKEYLKKVGKDNVGKDFDFTKAMNSDQRLIITEAITKVGNLTKGQPAVNRSVYSLMDKNIERMFKYGLREGKTMDEILKSFKNQIDDPDFLNKVVPLMIEKAKTGNYIKGIKKDLGVTLDDVNLSHMTAVVDDINQTFKIHNLFIGKSSLNTQESNIQKTIKKLQNNLKKDNISSSEKIKIKNELDELEDSLPDYYEPVSKNYPSASDVGIDVQKQIKEKISETMMGNPTYFKKDGGMVGIDHLIRPLGNF